MRFVFGNLGMSKYKNVITEGSFSAILKLISGSHYSFCRIFPRSRRFQLLCPAPKSKYLQNDFLFKFFESFRRNFDKICGDAPNLITFSECWSAFGQCLPPFDTWFDNFDHVVLTFDISSNFHINFHRQGAWIESTLYEFE